MQKCCCEKHIRICCTDEMGDFDRRQIPDGHGAIYKGGERHRNIPINDYKDRIVGYCSKNCRKKICPGCPIHG